MLKLLKLSTNMTLKLHNVLYPNVCGADIGLILGLHIIGLKTTKYCAAKFKLKFVCVCVCVRVDSCTDLCYFYVTNLRLV